MVLEISTFLKPWARLEALAHVQNIFWGFEKTAFFSEHKYSLKFIRTDQVFDEFHRFMNDFKVIYISCYLLVKTTRTQYSNNGIVYRPF